MILFWRSKCSTFLSILTPAHPSRQRSLSICPEASSFSTYHVSFDRLLPRARIANGSWVRNSNPFLTILYAFRSWHVSKSQSFSLLTRVSFSRMKRKKVWIDDASLLSETVTWLSGIPEDIIHQKLLCHHHQQPCSHSTQHARSWCVRTAKGHICIASPSNV